MANDSWLMGALAAQDAYRRGDDPPWPLPPQPGTVFNSPWERGVAIASDYAGRETPPLSATEEPPEMGSLLGMGRAGDTVRDVASDTVWAIPAGAAQGLEHGLYYGSLLSHDPSDKEFVTDQFAQHVTPTVGYDPHTAPGRYAKEISSVMANPINWSGPGGVAVKGAWNALSGAGGQAAADAVMGTSYEPYEQYARMAGSFGPMAAERAWALTGPAVRALPEGQIGVGGGKITQREVPPEPIRAYHSSPHDFEKFDLSKIGTGEGAQVYGHGLYFAENPAVSGQGGEYWQQFARRFEGTPEGYAANVLQSSRFDRGRATTDLDRLLKTYGSNSPPVIWEARDLLASGQPVGPRTYEVAIHAKPEQFLDWDRPLSQHFTDVQQAVRPLIEQTKKSFPRLEERADLTGELRGQDLYRAYSGHLGYPDFASERLREAGIPGIRYLDQGSRWNQALYNDNPIANEARKFIEAAGGNTEKAGELFYKSSPVDRWATTERDEIRRLIQMGGNKPTSNYVVFDPERISILKKYGLAGAVPTMGALAAGDRYAE